MPFEALQCKSTIQQPRGTFPSFNPFPLPLYCLTTAWYAVAFAATAALTVVADDPPPLTRFRLLVFFCRSFCTPTAQPLTAQQISASNTLIHPEYEVAIRQK
mmetsp:Transcript_52742/g.86634  ORF Transcript_52742/g.86634 Transcript_52742/m.86634 type:complete len:102 (+) Transcript_52742:569-874(+)